MVRICGWCNKTLGWVEGKGITTGICLDCSKQLLIEAGKENQITEIEKYISGLTPAPLDGILSQELTPISSY